MQKIHRVAFGSFLVLAALLAWTRLSRTPDTPQARVGISSTKDPVDVSKNATPQPDPIRSSEAYVLTQLRLGGDPGTFLMTIRQFPGVEKADFNVKSSTLAITHLTGEPGPKALAALAEQAGLIVRGEVLDLPLALGNPHLETCGSCGFEIYEQLRKKPGVHAVEVFLPVKNQLRLLVEPESISPSEVDQFFKESLQAAHQSP